MTDQKGQTQPSSPPCDVQGGKTFNPNVIQFPPSSSVSPAPHRTLFSEAHPDGKLMGPVFRRKTKSLPLCAGSEFFVGADGDVTQQHYERRGREKTNSLDPYRTHVYDETRECESLVQGIVRRGESGLKPKQVPGPHKGILNRSSQTKKTAETKKSESSPSPVKRRSFLDGILRRRQMALDIIGSEDHHRVPSKKQVKAPACKPTETAAPAGPPKHFHLFGPRTGPSTWYEP